MGWRNCCNVPQRYVLSFMGFLAMINAYTTRGCLSLALTEMVVKPNATKTDKIDQFEWDQEDQGLILGAFFYGYVITHVPGALLCKRFGGKYVLCFGLLVNAFLAICTPFIVHTTDKWGLVILRVFMGCGQGIIFPALYALLASWAPENERGRLGSFVFGGSQIGAIIGNILTGQLLYHFAWPTVFYFFGGVCIIWFISFMTLCYNSPDEHPFITDTEREYLRRELSSSKRNDKLPPIPWTAIFTSLPVWAMIIAEIGHDWGFYVVAIDLPKYLADVVFVPIQSNGFYSSLPFFSRWLFGVISGVACDYAIEKNYWTVLNARKWLTGIAAVGPGVFLLAASYAGSDELLVVMLFTIGMGFMGPWYAGVSVNALDLSPNYAPTLMAITNGIGALTGAAVPSVVGFLTPNKELMEWRIVFWMTFIFFVISIVFYSLWAAAEIQPWNDSEKQIVAADGKHEEDDKVEVGEEKIALNHHTEEP